MSETEISYCGDDRITAFPVPFTLYQETDLQVWVDDSHLTSGFKVLADKGMVIFAKAPASGAIVLLRRVLEVAKPPVFPAGVPASAAQVDHEFHRLTAAIQQVAEDVARTVARSPLSSSTADLTLPEPLPGRALTWNADGTGLANSTANLEAVARQAAQDAAAAGAMADKAATSAADAARSAREATVAQTGIRAAADVATRTIAQAADISMAEAHKAASLVSAVADPVAAYRKQRLLGLW